MKSWRFRWLMNIFSSCCKVIHRSRDPFLEADPRNADLVHLIRVGDAVADTVRLVSQELELGFVAEEFSSHSGQLSHRYATAGAEVDRSEIGLLQDAQGCTDDVVNMDPVTHLPAVAPDLNGHLLVEDALHDRHEGVLVGLVLAIARERANDADVRACPDGMSRHPLTEELRPAVDVCGRVVRVSVVADKLLLELPLTVRVLQLEW